jgi:hypothetical protein
MDRRTFLAGTGAVLLAAPLGAQAQEAGQVYRIGIQTWHIRFWSPARRAASAR